MFDNLSGLAIGLIVFTITIVVGLVVLTNLGNTQAVCPAALPYNASDQTCYNSTAGSGTAPTNAAWTTTNTLGGYLGTSGGGLASWTLAIIALAVGMLFISSLMNKRKY